MASSFLSQVPAIIHLVQQLKPTSVLDIGKGFGKYGFLIHEYVGIDNTKKLDAEKTLKDQSSIVIDAVEIDADLMMPHLSQIYNQVFFNDILKIYPQLKNYDLVLMIDIIEHIPRKEAMLLLSHLLQQGSDIIIATPLHFFEQELYESEFERHVSHWKKKDFSRLGNIQSQIFDAGVVYLLTKNKMNIRGFGDSLIKKVRRMARVLKNELHF